MALLFLNCSQIKVISMRTPVIDSYTCQRCGNKFSALSKTSFLGFSKVTCRMCREINYGPLRDWIRIAYWIILLSVFIGMPLLFVFLAAYALFKDYKLRHRSAEFLSI